jgi:predicted RNA binding protein YcfA (HicA-like mRNA interferase family)
MPRLPRLRGRQVIAALKKAGFELLRVKGSHHFMRFLQDQLVFAVKQSKIVS